MIKTLTNLRKQEKEKFVVPKGVQDVIPITAIYDDGIFQIGKDKFSKTYKFSDINYAVASREDKEAMFLEYSELLNSLDSGATTKITINNRRLNRLDFENNILIPMKGDSLDEYREEYNKILLEKATGANAIVQDKYMTISVNKKNIEDARNYFARVGADLIAHFGRLGSKCVELETDERLRIFHDFYRVGEESSFHFDIKETRKKGHSFKDYICPDSMEFEKDYFKMGDRYGRVLFLREYASYIKDSMVAELTDLNRNLMMSIDVVPVPTDEAVREAENRLLGVETNITNWQRRQNSNNNFSATVPYDMEQQKKEMKEFLDDLTTRDQRMMFAVITFVHTADSKEQLDNDTEALLTTARKHLCQFGVLKFQQVDGLNTVMPFGVRKIDTFRTLTTESLAVFIPFRVQDIFHENGIYYGQNVISKNMIIADRKQLLNGNSFILGVSGGGKSFAAKGEIENVILSSESDVIIIDPEREYSQLVKALGGEVIHISATSQNHINAMDMYITVSHKTADEMAAQYGFNEEQKEYLAELLADENNSLWSQVLYGITGSDDQIVTVALSQIGTMGGDPYWSWYGFNSRVEWCACFVSWCANECGYIDAGVIPKYAGCVNGVQWFKDRGQWLDNSAEPTPGMIIFFDWADESGQDGLSDHTGIVQKVENGRVYTVEGNSGDSVRQNSYPVGYYEILGYGAPAY